MNAVPSFSRISSMGCYAMVFEMACWEKHASHNSRTALDAFEQLCLRIDAEAKLVGLPTIMAFSSGARAKALIIKDGFNDSP